MKKGLASEFVSRQNIPKPSSPRENVSHPNRWLFCVYAMKKYLAAYRSQRGGARRRGIAFKLTFEEWLRWWGEDIERRGRGECDLQMQRIADAGAYELGSIKKGTPRENHKTATVLRRTQQSLRAGAELQSALDRAMFTESAEPEEELDEDEEYLADLGMKSSFGRRYSYVGYGRK